MTTTLSMVKGNSASIQCLVSKSDGSVIVIDKAWFTVRKKGYATVIFSYNTEDDPQEIVISGNSTTTPLLSVNVLPVDSRKLIIADCPFDFQVLLHTGEIYTPAIGIVSVTRNVTEEFLLNEDIPVP